MLIRAFFWQISIFDIGAIFVATIAMMQTTMSASDS